MKNKENKTNDTCIPKIKRGGDSKIVRESLPEHPLFSICMANLPIGFIQIFHEFIAIIEFWAKFSITQTFNNATQKICVHHL